MRKWLFTLCVCGFSAALSAQPEVQVYKADEQTQFNSSQIMVGSRLSFVVTADCNDYWGGGLFIEGENRFLGNLVGRDSDPNSRDWKGSHYENAGPFANVTSWNDSNIWGYDLYGDAESKCGNWFIIDYEATGAGDPNVWFLDYDISWDRPVYTKTFEQIKSVDYNNSDMVNLPDFAVLCRNWLLDDCGATDWCQGADIDEDGTVDIDDLLMFSNFWLWDPNMAYMASHEELEYDPDIIFSLKDAESQNEITIATGQSVTLYVNVEYQDPNSFVYFITPEINISNPDLGAIDNTAYPYGSTAILFGPRFDIFDYWGPGYYQHEGLEITCGRFYPMPQGDVVSFTYTATQPGDVTLSFYHNNTDTVEYREIIIHQTVPVTSYNLQQSSVPTEELQVEALETIWLENEEIKETVSQDQWDSFISSVKDTLTSR